MYLQANTERLANAQIFPQPRPFLDLEVIGHVYVLVLRAAWMLRVCTTGPSALDRSEVRGRDGHRDTLMLRPEKLSDLFG